jgi:glycosyltransferase involved in cell wall biosynthesis
MRCRNVVDALAKRGHDVLVITTSCPDPHCELHINDKKICRVLHQKTDVPTVFGQIVHDRKDMNFIAQKVKEFNPDIIYLWHIQNLSNAILPYFSSLKIPIVYDQGGAGLIYLGRVHKRGIYFYKNERDSLIKKGLKQAVYRIANLVSFDLIQPQWHWPSNMRIYFNSRSSLKHSKEMGAPVDGASVIHSGIQITDFPCAPRGRMRSPLTVLVPSRIKPEKGIKDAAALIGELLKRGIASRLKLIGKVQSQDFFESILEDIHKGGLDDSFEYMPMVTHAELARFYQAADVCFFPTYFRTGFSRVPLEAMASGCLVLTYGNEGSNEIVHDGETGFIVPEGDILSAADRIESMTRDSTAYQRITQNARKQIEREHTMEHYINSIEAYLRESM